MLSSGGIHRIPWIVQDEHAKFFSPPPHCLLSPPPHCLLSFWVCFLKIYVKLRCVLFGFIRKLYIPVSNIYPLTFTMKMAQYLKIDGSGSKLLAAYHENLSLGPQNHINLGVPVYICASSASVVRWGRVGDRRTPQSFWPANLLATVPNDRDPVLHTCPFILRVPSGLESGPRAAHRCAVEARPT